MSSMDRVGIVTPFHLSVSPVVLCDCHGQTRIDISPRCGPETYLPLVSVHRRDPRIAAWIPLARTVKRVDFLQGHSRHYILYVRASTSPLLRSVSTISAETDIVLRGIYCEKHGQIGIFFSKSKRRYLPYISIGAVELLLLFGEDSPKTYSCSNLYLYLCQFEQMPF